MLKKIIFASLGVLFASNIFAGVQVLPMVVRPAIPSPRADNLRILSIHPKGLSVVKESSQGTKVNFVLKTSEKPKFGDSVEVDVGRDKDHYCPLFFRYYISYGDPGYIEFYTPIPFVSSCKGGWSIDQYMTGWHRGRGRLGEVLLMEAK